MKGYLSIEIPCKKYIKAYLIRQYGEKPVLNKDTEVGNKLFDLLVHKINDRKKEYSSKTYKDSIKVYVSIRTFHKRGGFLNETNVISFNRFLERRVKEKLYFLMNFYVDIVPSFESNLLIVRRELGIDEDAWETDSIKKDYYRYRRKHGMKKLNSKKERVSERDFF